MFSLFFLHKKVRVVYFDEVGEVTYSYGIDNNMLTLYFESLNGVWTVT